MLNSSGKSAAALATAIALASQIDVKASASPRLDVDQVSASAEVKSFLGERLSLLASRRGAHDEIENWAEYWHSEGQWQEATNPPR